MKTCDTCKWWGNLEGNEQFGYGPDEEYYPGAKPCLKIEDGAHVTGFEMGSMPYLLTDPKFGCIHHEDL